MTKSADMRHRPCFLLRRRVRLSSFASAPSKSRGCAGHRGAPGSPRPCARVSRSAQAVAYRRKPGSPASRARCLRLAPCDPRWADRFKLPLGEAGCRELIHRCGTGLCARPYGGARVRAAMSRVTRGTARRDHTTWAAQRCRVASVTATASARRSLTRQTPKTAAPNLRRRSSAAPHT